MPYLDLSICPIPVSARIDLLPIISWKTEYLQGHDKSQNILSIRMLNPQLKIHRNRAFLTNPNSMELANLQYAYFYDSRYSQSIKMQRIKMQSIKHLNTHLLLQRFYFIPFLFIWSRPCRFLVLLEDLLLSSRKEYRLQKGTAKKQYYGRALAFS